MPNTKCNRSNTCNCTGCADFNVLLNNNRSWIRDITNADPEFFERLAENDVKTPTYMWIGCCDSRVEPNKALGLLPGEVTVHRNIGNVVMHSDMNVMSSLEHAVMQLGVKHIIVCGHYNCGAVRGALKLPQRTPGLVNCWISDIRIARNEHSAELLGLSDNAAVDRLCELNVLRQCFHVCTSPVVQNAWASGYELYVHGVIYAVGKGILQRLIGPVSRPLQMAEEEASVERRRVAVMNLQRKSYTRRAPDVEDEDEDVSHRHPDSTLESKLKQNLSMHMKFEPAPGHKKFETPARKNFETPKSLERKGIPAVR